MSGSAAMTLLAAAIEKQGRENGEAYVRFRNCWIRFRATSGRKVIKGSWGPRGVAAGAHFRQALESTQFYVNLLSLHNRESFEGH